MLRIICMSRPGGKQRLVLIRSSGLQAVEDRPCKDFESSASPSLQLNEGTKPARAAQKEHTGGAFIDTHYQYTLLVSGLVQTLHMPVELLRG